MNQKRYSLFEFFVLNYNEESEDMMGFPRQNGYMSVVLVFIDNKIAYIATELHVDDLGEERAGFKVRTANEAQEFDRLGTGRGLQQRERTVEGQNHGFSS